MNENEGERIERGREGEKERERERRMQFKTIASRGKIFASCKTIPVARENIYFALERFCGRRMF